MSAGEYYRSIRLECPYSDPETLSCKIDVSGLNVAMVTL